MSGINQNSFNGEGRLKISSSTTTYLTLGYTGSSQLDFDLPQSYGSSGQGLITNGSGGLSWGTVGGGGGTNGTSGSSGSSGSNGTSGSSGTTPVQAYWFGEYQSTQVLATGSTLIGLTVSNETNFSGTTAAVFDFDGTYKCDYSITFGEKQTGGYPFNGIMLYFLKYNGATVSSSVELLAVDKHNTDPGGTVGLSSYIGSTIISATANSTLEFWARTPFLIWLRPDGTQPGYTAKMSVYKIA